VRSQKTKRNKKQNLIGKFHPPLIDSSYPSFVNALSYSYQRRHIALQIQYDGGKYYGFASQDDQETVERHLFQALMKLKLIEDPKVSCATVSSF